MSIKILFILIIIKKIIHSDKGIKMLMREKELPLVSMAFMNEVHKEDIEIINELFELVLSYEKEANSTNEMAITKKYIEWTKSLH